LILPKVQFVKPHLQQFSSPVGANLMRELLSHQIPVASSCQGDGVCAKCRLRITSSSSTVNPISELEKILLAKNNLSSPWRISCQVEIRGDVIVDAGYW